MWLFGQVWFACLVGFVVGVGLTWLWQVRPLNRRLADLERSARVADRPARPSGRQDEDYRPGFGNTTYDSSVAAPSNVGVSTPSGRPGLDEMFEPEPQAEPTHVDATRVHSVDDYVEALVQEYQGDAPGENRAWTNRNPEAVESWRPGALGARLDAADQHDDPHADAQLTSYQSVQQHDDAQLTSYQPVQQHDDAELTSYQAVQPHDDAQLTGYQPVVRQDPEPEPGATEATQLQPRAFGTSYSEFGNRGNADEQYLDYLRSGAMDVEPTQAVTPEPEPEVVRDYVEHEPEPVHEYQDYFAADDYSTQDHMAEQHVAEQHDEVAEEHPAEVTSILPPIVDEPAEIEEPAESGEQTVAEAQPVVQHEDEQAESDYPNYFEPSEPLTTLVRPHSSGGGPIASAQPFQLSGPDRVDANSQQGQLTPIEEGGFQPFAKIYDEEYPAEAGAQDWQDDWSDEREQANGAHAPEETEPGETTGPVPAKVIAQADGASLFEPETAAESTSVFSPITDEPQAEYEQDEPAPRHQIVEHSEPEYADYDEDYQEADEDPSASGRSLFEPVIEPEQPTSYLTPVAPPAPQNGGQSPQPAPQPTQQLQPQQLQPQSTGPRPIRVRTGVAQPNRPQVGVEPTRPVRAPSGSAGWQSGPFGPGSALPLPDGSAPSPQFRIKARTSSMVFHTESSPFYDRLEPQVWFASQDDAQRAGFTSWERPRTW
jgi:hypothetical protein